MIRLEAKQKYHFSLQMIDGAQALIKIIQTGRLDKLMQESKTAFCKGAAQHSLCWNALDSGKSFMAMHAMTERIVKNGKLSPSNPPWFEAFQKITKKVIHNSERRKTVDVFHSHLHHMIGRAFQEEFILGGWVINGMGIGPNGTYKFSFEQFMRHWSLYLALSADQSAEL